MKRWKGPASAGTPGYNPATYFYYDGSDMVQEGPSASITDRVYVHGGRVDEIVASQVSGVWYNHHYDAQGNCILLSTTSGTIQEQYDYDAFGYPYFYTPSGGKAGNVKTRFLFTGREWISEMKIYDYRARMYQPELGRFLQPDPQEFAAGDYNLYRYCHNDPVNKIDPTGLATEELVGSIHRDIMWDMARYADTSNTSQGSFADFTNNAYMGVGGGSTPSVYGKQASAAPGRTGTGTGYADLKETLQMVPAMENGHPMEDDFGYNKLAYYQLTLPDPSGGKGTALGGIDYRCQEKTTDGENKFNVPGGKIETKRSDDKPKQQLTRGGLFTDQVGLEWRPTSRLTGTLVLYQRFALTFRGQHVNVSTVLKHTTKVNRRKVTNTVSVVTP